MSMDIEKEKLAYAIAREMQRHIEAGKSHDESIAEVQRATRRRSPRMTYVRGAGSAAGVLMTTAFKAWREGMGYTQEQASDALGISKETYGRYDRGERYPPKPVRRLMWAEAHEWRPRAWPIDDDEVPRLRAWFAVKQRTKGKPSEFGDFPELTKKWMPSDGDRPTDNVQRTTTAGQRQPEAVQRTTSIGQQRPDSAQRTMSKGRPPLADGHRTGWRSWLRR
jgi:transcriptional regulator with XRE-family HTH domain